MQDFDKCEDGAYEGEGVSQPKCRLSWQYAMLDSITDLSPRFLMPYRVGATNLSIVIDDREGAARIFEKGVRQYPNDWVLAYRAAYHFLFEVGDEKRGAELLDQAARNGAPAWTYALAAKIRTRIGQAAMAQQVLSGVIKEMPEGESKEILKKRLAEVEETLRSNTQSQQPPAAQ